MLRISNQSILLLLIFTILVSGIVLADSDSDSSIHPSYTDPNYTIFPLIYKQVQYNISYKITSGVIEDIILHCELAGSIIILAHNKDNTNANLIISIPRQAADTRLKNGEDDEFWVLVNGEEIYYEEVKESQIRTFIIELTGSGSKEIEIIGTWHVGIYANPDCGRIVHNPPYSIILPPLKQLESVENIPEIICREENHQLIFKKDTGNPACVRESTMKKLIERGWTSGYSPQHTDIMEGNKNKNYGMTEETLVTESNLEAERFKPNSGVIKDRGLEIEAERLMESNETIITGNTDILSQDVTLTVTAPNGNIVYVAQVSPSFNGDFTAKIMTGGRFWIQDGFYTVTAQQNEDPKYISSTHISNGCGIALVSGVSECFEW